MKCLTCENEATWHLTQVDHKYGERELHYCEECYEQQHGRHEKSYLNGGVERIGKTKTT